LPELTKRCLRAFLKYLYSEFCRNIYKQKTEYPKNSGEKERNGSEVVFDYSALLCFITHESLILLLSFGIWTLISFYFSSKNLNLLFFWKIAIGRETYCHYVQEASLHFAFPFAWEVKNAKSYGFELRSKVFSRYRNYSFGLVHMNYKVYYRCSSLHHQMAQFS